MTDEQELELSVRRILAEEVNKHREFLQIQFKYLVWSIGIMLAAGAIVFTYLFGDSIETTKVRLIEQIDTKVVEYRIVESLKKRLDAFTESAVDEAVNSVKTKDQINLLVKTKTDEYVRASSEKTEQKLSQLVTSQVVKFKDLDPEELIRKVTLPSGSILAFNLESCPKGWNNFQLAAGRTIVGSGKGENLTPYAKGEIGGEEVSSITISNLPSHQHLAPFGVQASEAAYGQGGAARVISGSSVIIHPLTKTSPVGNGNSFSNMQPFIAMLYCEKI
ncbi:MAG: hypothetical protein V3U87_16170 [Methylococcaceae bacterium]